MAKKKNEVSVAGQFSKENVPAMLEVVNAQIKELQSRFGGDKSTLSNDELDDFGRVSDIKDVPTLIKAISAVNSREKAYKEAITLTDKTITLTKFPFKLNGSTAKVWIECINRQIGEVTFKDELNRLKEAATFLEKHVSKEQQFENDMAKFMDIVKVK